MRAREAVLIANSVSYGDRSKNVSRTVVQHAISELTTHLASFEEEFTFKTTPVVDKTSATAKKEVLKVVRACGNNDKTLLLYYFGHGVIPPQDEELYLYFRDSRQDEPPTMFKFSEIVEWLRHYKVPEVLIVLDCCHAGMVATKLQPLTPYGGTGKSYLMASVTPKDKARVDYDTELPLGTLSKFLLQSFRNPGVRSQGREVTFGSFFGHVKKSMKAVSKQEPYPVDGGLADELFFRQTSRPVIPLYPRSSAPKKSVYKKLFVLGSALLASEFSTEERLYAFMKKQRPVEFLQPYKVGANDVTYDFASPPAFHAYVQLARLLGLMEEGEPVRLTPIGKRMIRHDGRLFNVELHSLVEARWSRYGLKVSDLEDIIGQRIKANSAPSADAIYQYASLGREILISKYLFKVLLDLTGYVGALSYAADKTFFIAGSEEVD